MTDSVLDSIAVLGDDPRRTDAMRQEVRELFPEAQAVFFDNAPDMVAWLKDQLQSVGLLCLDHDLGPNRGREGVEFDPGTGRDVADFLSRQAASCPVLIHSSNPAGADGMQFTLEEAGWSVERVVPFDDLTWIKAQWSRRVGVLGRGKE